MKSVYSMEEQLVSLKTARSAKKQGFKERCRYFFNEGSGWKVQEDYMLRQDKTIEAPSQSLLQKWLREEKDILVEVTFSNRLSRKLYEAAHEKPSLNFSWKIYTSIKDPSHFFPEFWTDDTFETYEEALEKGLQEALKMVR
jgi:hypothetical protein